MLKALILNHDHITPWKKTIVLIAAAVAAGVAMASDSGRAPLMGWSSWNTYGLNISDQLIREQADAMVSTGLKDAGYRLLRA